MTRTHLSLLILAFAVGIGLFKLKYEVVSLEQHKIKLVQLIKEHKSAIHILQAELTHLNNPKRIEKLSKSFLLATPMVAADIVKIKDLPVSLKTNLPVNSKAKDDDGIDNLLDALEAVNASPKIKNQVQNGR